MLMKSALKVLIFWNVWYFSQEVAMVTVCFGKIDFFSPSPKIPVSATVSEHYFLIVHLFSSNKKFK